MIPVLFFDCILTACLPGEGRGTSLSVTARKAAERVVAQLDGDGGKSLLSI
jgi:hypothetical protein